MVQGLAEKQRREVIHYLSREILKEPIPCGR
jgi:hypothetical protein